MSSLFTSNRIEKIAKGASRFTVGFQGCERWFEINTPLRAAHFLAQATVESQNFSTKGLGEQMFYSSFVRIIQTFKSRKLTEHEALQLRSVSSRQAKENAGLREYLKGEDQAQLDKFFPTTPVNREEALANRVYGEILGNRGVASGDGWAFRGSGLIQTTGRDNFSKSLALLCKIQNTEAKASNGGAGKKSPGLEFVEMLQGVSDGELSARVQEMARYCTSPDDFLKHFAEACRTDPFLAAMSAGAWWQLNGCNELADANKFREITRRVNKAALHEDQRQAAFDRIYGLFSASSEGARSVPTAAGKGSRSH